MVMIKLNFAKFKQNFSEKDKFASIYIWIFHEFLEFLPSAYKTP